MGMTIDKTISELEILKKNTFSYMSAHQAFITAIDTLLKYQKIQKIMNADLEHIHPLDRDKYIVASIKEVLEDGNDD